MTGVGVKDQTQVAVVTGATAGIGLATAMMMAGQGIAVFGVGRDESRCVDARRMILASHPQASVEYLLCDLSSQKKIRRLAQEIHRRTGSLHILANIAGTVSSRYMESEDGVELQFAVNHLAPFLLTCELLPLLRESPQGRIITVSSESHYGARLDFDDLMMRSKYSCLKQYKRAKLCNVLFTAELNRRLGTGSTVRAFAVDPGLVNTEIGLKGTCGIERCFWKLRRRGGTPPEVPAACILYLATDPILSQSNDVYWRDCRPKRPDPIALRADVARQLWDVSERLCGK